MESNMKKLVAYLTAASLMLSSLSLPIFAEDTAETDNPPEPTLEERIAEGMERYEHGFEWMEQSKDISEEDTIERWDTYLSEYEDLLAALTKVDKAQDYLLETISTTTATESSDTTTTTTTTTATTSTTASESIEYEGGGYSSIPKEHVSKIVYDAVKAVMPEKDWENMDVEGEEYHLYFIDGEVIVMTDFLIDFCDDQKKAIINLVILKDENSKLIYEAVEQATSMVNALDKAIDVLISDNPADTMLEQAIDGAEDAIESLSGVDATLYAAKKTAEKLYSVFFAMNERNRELLEIEMKMTEEGLWNVVAEETDIPKMPGTTGNGESDASGSTGGDAPDAEVQTPQPPQLCYNLGSGDDTYYVYDDEDPVYAIIAETGKGESGKDTLSFCYDVSPESLQFVRIDGNLFINDMEHEVYLMIPCHFSDSGKRIETIRFNDDTALTYDVLCDIADVQIGTEAEDFIDGYPEVNHMFGLDGNDTLRGRSSSDDLFGFGGDDILTLDDSCLGKLFGVGGNNFAYGMDGNDTVILDNGNDFIWGGKGDDIIRSGAGNDIIYYELGDGNDTVDDSRGESTLPYEGQDVLYLSEGILPEEVSVTLSPNTKIFYLHINKTGDIITLPGNLISGITPVFPIEEIRFADGTLWTRNDLLECARFFYGTEQDDTLECYLDSNAEFYGNDGNDTMIGKDGNDSFYGGKGDDYLRGGNGDDTFYYELGDGNDTIDMGNGKSSYPQNGYNVLCLGEGILPEDIVIERSYNNYSYTLWLTKTNESITMTGNVISGITNYFPIKEIRFADGTIWKRTDLEANYVKWIRGTDGNDTVRDSTDNDTVYCGKGNDWIDGGEGDDLYIYETGDGRDSICDSSIWGNGHNTLRFGEGITAEDLYIETVKVRSEKFSRLYVRDRASFVELRGVADILLADGTMMTVSEAAELLKPAAELTSDLTGDLSCDGALTGDDVRLFLEHLTGESTLRYWETADLNADGVLNALDLTVLKQLICAAAS